MNNLYLVFCFVNIFVFSAECAPTSREKLSDIIQTYTKTHCTGLNKNVIMAKNLTYFSSCKDLSLESVPNTITFENLNTFLCVGIFDAQFRLCDLFPGVPFSGLPQTFNDLREQLETIQNSPWNDTCETFKMKKPVGDDTSDIVAKLSPAMLKMNDKLYDKDCGRMCSDFGGTTNVFCSMLMYIRLLINQIQMRTKLAPVAKPAITSTVEQLAVNKAPSVEESEQSRPKTAKTSQSVNTDQVSIIKTVSAIHSEASNKSAADITPASVIAEPKNAAPMKTKSGSNALADPHANHGSTTGPNANPNPNPNARLDSVPAPVANSAPDAKAKAREPDNKADPGSARALAVETVNVKTNNSIKLSSTIKSITSAKADDKAKSTSAHQTIDHDAVQHVTQHNLNPQAVVQNEAPQKSAASDTKSPEVALPAGEVSGTRVQSSAPDTAQMSDNNTNKGAKDGKDTAEPVDGSFVNEQTDAQDKDAFGDEMPGPDGSKDKQEMMDADQDDEGEDGGLKDDNERLDGNAAATDKESPMPAMSDQSTGARDYVDVEDSNFFVYFMFISVLFIAGYVVYHNKQKILALVLEGRRDRNARRRPNTASYRKLNSNLEEAVTSKCSGSASHVIY